MSLISAFYLACQASITSSEGCAKSSVKNKKIVSLFCIVIVSLYSIYICVCICGISAEFHEITGVQGGGAVYQELTFWV